MRERNLYIRDGSRWLRTPNDCSLTATCKRQIVPPNPIVIGHKVQKDTAQVSPASLRAGSRSCRWSALGSTHTGELTCNMNGHARTYGLLHTRSGWYPTIRHRLQLLRDEPKASPSRAPDEQRSSAPNIPANRTDAHAITRPLHCPFASPCATLPIPATAPQPAGTQPVVSEEARTSRATRPRHDGGWRLMKKTRKKSTAGPHGRVSPGVCGGVRGASTRAPHRGPPSVENPSYAIVSSSISSVLLID